MEAHQQKHAVETSVAQCERIMHEAKQLQLAMSMCMAADAEAVAQLAYSNKEKEAEITSLHHDHRICAQNLELRRARDIE
eukprot:315445-Heterocapsa_arctica.AAC.1